MRMVGEEVGRWGQGVRFRLNEGGSGRGFGK